MKFTDYFLQAKRVEDGQEVVVDMLWYSPADVRKYFDSGMHRPGLTDFKIMGLPPLPAGQSDAVVVERISNGA